MSNEHGRLIVLSQDDKLNYDVKLEVIRSGMNENRWDYRNVDKCGNSFRGTPILCAVVDGEWGDGHNMRENIDPNTGVTTYSFTDATSERIVGCIYDTDDAVTYEERDGESWVIAKGKLWRFYCSELVDKIATQGKCDISAETVVTQSYVDEESGAEVFTDWKGIGVTILGDDVAPAVPNAKIKANSYEAMRKEFEQLKLRAASLYEKPQAKNNSVERKIVKMSKNAIREAQKLVPENYKVLAANGNAMCVRDEAGALHTYEITEGAEFNAEMLKSCTLYTRIGEDEFEVDVTAEFEAFNAEKDRLAQSLEEEKNRSASLQTRINEMEHEEAVRRIQECKDAVNAYFNKCVEKCGDCSYDTNARDAILADIDAGKYTEMMRDGKWIGCEAALTAMKAALMDMNLNAAEKRSREMVNVNQWVDNASEYNRDEASSTLQDVISKALRH